MRNKKSAFAFLACAFLLLCARGASAADLLPSACQSLIPAAPIAANTPVDRATNPYWQQQYPAEVEQARQQPDGGTLFLGDSITNRWPGGILKNASPTHPILSLGMEGDKTQELLWRLINGKFLASHPHFVVLLIGTNNKDSATDVAAGIASILLYIRQNSPATKTLVIGVYPRGPWDEYKEKITLLNKLIASCQSPFVLYADYGYLFLNQDQTLKDDMYQGDHLHLTGRAYTQLAPVIYRDLTRFDAQH